MTQGIFRAYDIRGVYPQDINPAVVFEIGSALGRYFQKGKIIVGHEVRFGTPSLYRSVIKGLKHGSRRLQIVKIGMATAPMFYFLVYAFQAAGGIFVSASHNPKEYNGLKVVGRNATMISGKEVLRIMNHEK
jgi:phosphomannomutase